MRILFAGTPANAAQALRRIHAGLAERQSPVEIVGVLTREDAPIGRKRVLTPSPVAQAAEELGLPVIKANRVTDEVLGEIAQVSAEAAVVVAYGAMLRENALAALPLGWYNLHYSLLPDLRGAAPVQRAIMLGREVTGATIFRIDAGLDTGPVFRTVEHPLTGTETAGSLLESLTDEASAEAVDFLAELAADTGLAERGEPQPETEVEYAHKLSAEDARLRLDGTAAEADRQARGTLPAPGPWLLLDGQKFKIAEVGGVVPGRHGEPGTVTAAEGGVVIAFAEGGLLARRVQPFGKKPMNAADWYRGAQASADEELRLTHE